MDVYLAADFARAGDVEALARRCEAADPTVRVVSRWHRTVEPEEAAAATRIGGPPDPAAARAAATRNLEDIDRCDVFVVLTTGEPARGGRHFETGYACAAGKRVVVAGPVEHAFQHLPGVHHTTPEDLGATLAMLLPMHDCAMAVLCDGERVLLCHRHPAREWVPNVWDFPGGHVEDGETPHVALSRELGEELGVVIEPPRRAPDEVHELRDEGVRLSVWFLEYRGPVENRCPEEHDELRWVSLEEASRLDLADPSYVELIRRALAASARR